MPTTGRPSPLRGRAFQVPTEAPTKKHSTSPKRQIRTLPTFHRNWTEKTLPIGRPRLNRHMGESRTVAFGNYLAQCFRAIWRSVGAPPQREPDISRHEYGGYSQAESIITPIVGATHSSREGTLVLPRRSSGLSGTPNSSQTLRHIAIKATPYEEPKLPFRNDKTLTFF
jgi:hypothetical protein